MRNKVLVDEDTIIDLCARATIDRFMIEFLTTNLFNDRTSPDQREGLIEGLREKIKAITPNRSEGERDAVMASDVLVRVQEHADKLADVLRARLL